MPKIIHRNDPSGITKPIVYDVESGVNLLDWVISTFKTQEDLCGELSCSFVLNKKEIFRSDHDNVDNSILDFTVGELDEVVIINRPAGIGTIAIYVAIAAVAASVIMYLSMPKLPGAEEGRNESSNNRLNAATNAFRPRQGRPECFGFGVSYPDFIQPSYYYYENNNKIQVGLFFITEGSATITEVRVGETNIVDIPESTAQVFGPYSKPQDKYLTIHQGSANVDGQVLIAPNDEALVLSNFTFSITNSSNGGGTQVYLTVPSSLIADLSITSESYIYLRTPDLNGVFDVLYIDYDEIGNSYIELYTGFVYTGIESVIGTIGRGYKDGVIGSGFAGELDYWIGWFNTPGDKAQEVYIHWQAPLGIRTKKGKAITLAVRFEVEHVGSGQVFSRDVSITKATLDPQYITTIFNNSTNPGMPVGEYRVRARRLTNVVDADGNASEQLKVEGYISVTPYSVQNFGDCTTMLVQRRATLFSPDQAGKKINVDYRRKLPYYNRITDTYETGNLVETNSFMDAVAYTLIMKGGESQSTVNLAEGYAIYDGLTSDRLGGFTFTFDDADLSKGERIDTMCNVARCVGFHDGREWRFARDELKPFSSAMFNRRSVTGSNAKQAWQPQRDDDSDSVRIVYVDDDKNTEVYAERSFDILTGQIISDSVGDNPIEIKLAGCRDVYQAKNRADLEIRRIAYQRRSVRETTYREALELELLDRVSWVDVNDIDTFDGEILGITGDVYDTTERFLPEDGKQYVVFLTDNEGYQSNTVSCSARSDTEFGFIAVGLSGAYVASGDQQIGSRYFIADADDMSAASFTLKSRMPSDDGRVEIELVEYKEEMYEMDGIAPPSNAPILPAALNVLDVKQVGGSSVSTFELKNDGQLSANGDLDIWYSGGITANIGAKFEVYAELISGGLYAGAVNQWLPLTNDVSWSVVKFGAIGIADAVLRLTIRETEYNDNNITRDIIMSAVIAAPVALPASIDILTESSTNSAQASLSVLSNGEWLASDLTTGEYTTVINNIGELYECRATNVVGNLDQGVADVWVTLSGQGAIYSILTDISEVTTFDLEVREIANVANTATTPVSLAVTFF